MAERPLTLNIENFVDPDTGRPVSLGFVYIGEPDTNPETLGFRKTVTLVEESGANVVIQPAAQPLTLSAGGVILHNGSPVVVLVDGVYSVKVTDQLGAQVYYVPRANEYLESGSDTGFLILNGSFENETVVSGQPDDWNVNPTPGSGTIEIDIGTVFHGKKSLRFTSTDVTGAGFAFNETRFPVSEGQPIFVAFDYLSTAVDTQTVVRIDWYDEFDVLISGVDILDNTTNNPVAAFERFQSLVTPPSGAHTGFIVLSGMGIGGVTTSGSTWFDDVVVWNAYDFVFSVTPMDLLPPIAMAGLTSVIIPDIPDWVTIIHLNLNDVSVNAASSFFRLRVGTSIGIDPGTNYNSSALSVVGAVAGASQSINGFMITRNNNNLLAYSGIVTLSRADKAAFTWNFSANMQGGGEVHASAGRKTTTGELTQLEIDNFGNAFDNGSVSISYE